MAAAAAEVNSPVTLNSDSEPAPSGEFPHSVNWSNPRVAAILETAAECFSRGGFSTTTLADIGRELGLRKSIVHYYFTSKATLVREVQSYAYGRYLQVIRSALHGVPLSRPLAGDQETASSAVSGEHTIDELPPESQELSTTRHRAPASGLQELWNILRSEKSVRGLNLELWSEGRRNEELSARAETFETEAQKLISDHFLSTTNVSEGEAENLATLTLAVLDGLTVREERGEAAGSTADAFSAFLKLLENK